ncbi:MAG: SDR family NAD(P)-dependent oxidoreductase, partial [Alphaproteobacteria bacterium]
MQGKSVIITGAAGGLGKATAATLAKAGATIGVLDVKLEGAEKVVKDIEAVGGKAFAVIGDITKRADALELFDRAVQKLGRVDGLVNNAGIYPRRPIMEITDEEWNASLGVNVRGLYNMTVAAIAH